MEINSVTNHPPDHITIVIPVLNEKDNITQFLQRIFSLLNDPFSSKIREIIIVDDGSTDGTREEIKAVINSKNNISIKLVERDEKKGTVNAQLHGISLSKYNGILIMDADLQHPPEYIPELIKQYYIGYDMIIASRYVKGGRAERNVMNGIISRGANLMARIFLPPVRKVKDPISGYFLVDKRIINLHNEFNGFNKLALSILSYNQKISVKEIPFCFKERKFGVSKVSPGGVGFVFKYLREILTYRQFYFRNYMSSHFFQKPGDLTVLERTKL